MKFIAMCSADITIDNGGIFVVVAANYFINHTCSHNVLIKVDWEDI